MNESHWPGFQGECLMGEQAGRDATVARRPKGHIKAFMSGRAGREGDEALTKLSHTRPDKGHNSTET